jgi:hypothetical protein
MKKAVKIIVGVVVVLLVIVVGVILSLPMTIGPLVKSAAATGGPKVLGVDVAVGDVKLRPFAGQLTITDLKVGNPEGYTDTDSFAVKTVDVKLDTKSLMGGDTIVIDKIMIDGPAILYEVKDGKSNFDKMLARVAKAEAEEKDKSGQDKEKKPGKKVVVREFVLQDSKVAYSSKLTFNKPITMSLPTVKAKGIGEKSGGATAVEALGEIVTATIEGLKDAVTGAVSASAGVGGDALKKGGDAARDVAADAGAAAKDAAKSAEKAAKEAAGKLKGLFGK